MKKRAMKKWIPKGMYCHGDGSKKNPKCKWRKYITTIKRDRSNCKHSDFCDDVCWSDESNSCHDMVYRCEYMKYTDFTQESLLWDECKECDIKDFYLY